MKEHTDLKIRSAKILIVLLIAVTILGALYQELLLYGGEPAQRGRTEKSLIDILPGEGFQRIAARLVEAGIVNGPIKFKLLARLKGFDKKIKAGEYLLSASLSPNQIFEILVNGRVYLHKLTVPEGYTLHQIAALVEKAGLTAASDFLKTAQDAAFVRNKEIDAETFEGYLFPETYYFPKNVTPKKIVSTMVQRFWSTILPGWQARSKELGLSIHKIITLASIIEKETGIPAERPLISSVFHNRLKKGMRLESDPTVIYGIEGFEGNITRKHLEERTPYNTYLVRGLPPGPIANPGFESIKAALYPADTEYLYFVSRKDKTHQFSSNIDDHNRAVRKYQLGR